MQKIPIKKGLLCESIKYPLIFFIIILLIFYIYTLFHPIPTPISAKRWNRGGLLSYRR